MFHTADMAWNEAAQRLYLANYGTSPLAPLSLMELDPVTNTVGRVAALTTNPEQMALSDDGQYAYVLEHTADGNYLIERFRISDFTVDETMPLGHIAGGFEIHPVPG